MRSIVSQWVPFLLLVGYLFPSIGCCALLASRVCGHWWGVPCL